MRIGRPRTAGVLGAMALVAHVAAFDADAQSGGTGRSQAGRGPLLSIAVNGGIQAAGPGFADRFDFEHLVEPATAEAVYPAGNTGMVEAGVQVRLARRVGAGVAVSSRAGSAAARVEAYIPHPFFFDQPRMIAGEADAIRRREAAVHLLVTYTVDPRGPLAIVLSGGPSFMNAEQELVTGVRYSESYPFDTATFEAAETRRIEGSAPGFNVGGDVIWMVSRNVGIGGLLRFSRATIPLAAPGGRTMSIDAGGLHAGAGLRVMF